MAVKATFGQKELGVSRHLLWWIVCPIFVLIMHLHGLIEHWITWFFPVMYGVALYATRLYEQGPGKRKQEEENRRQIAELNKELLREAHEEEQWEEFQWPPK